MKRSKLQGLTERMVIPQDAQGEIIWLTGADVQLCVDASVAICEMFDGLREHTEGGTPSELSQKVRGMMEADRQILTESLAAVQHSGRIDRARLVASRELLRSMFIVLTSWYELRPEKMVEALAEFKDSGVPIERAMEICAAKFGITIPNTQDMAALHTKLLRISDAMGGKSGVKA